MCLTTVTTQFNDEEPKIYKKNKVGYKCVILSKSKRSFYGQFFNPNYKKRPTKFGIWINSQQGKKITYNNHYSYYLGEWVYKKYDSGFHIFTSKSSAKKWVQLYKPKYIIERNLTIVRVEYKNVVAIGTSSVIHLKTIVAKKMMVTNIVEI